MSYPEVKTIKDFLSIINQPRITEQTSGLRGIEVLLNYLAHYRIGSGSRDGSSINEQEPVPHLVGPYLANWTEMGKSSIDDALKFLNDFVENFGINARRLNPLRQNSRVRFIIQITGALRRAGYGEKINSLLDPFNDGYILNSRHEIKPRPLHSLFLLSYAAQNPAKPLSSFDIWARGLGGAALEGSVATGVVTAGYWGWASFLGGWEAFSVVAGLYLALAGLYAWLHVRSWNIYYRHHHKGRAPPAHEQAFWYVSHTLVFAVYLSALTLFTSYWPLFYAPLAFHFLTDAFLLSKYFVVVPMEDRDSFRKAPWILLHIGLSPFSMALGSKPTGSTPTNESASETGSASHIVESNLRQRPAKLGLSRATVRFVGVDDEGLRREAGRLRNSPADAYLVVGSESQKERLLRNAAAFHGVTLVVDDAAGRVGFLKALEKDRVGQLSVVVDASAKEQLRRSVLAADLQALQNDPDRLERRMEVRSYVRGRFFGFSVLIPMPLRDIAQAVVSHWKFMRAVLQNA